LIISRNETSVDNQEDKNNTGKTNGKFTHFDIKTDIKQTNFNSNQNQ